VVGSCILIALLAFLSADNCVGFLCWACCTSPCPSFTILSLMPFSQSPFSEYLKQKQRPLWPQHRLPQPSTTPRQPELPPPRFKAATPPIWIPHTTKKSTDVTMPIPSSPPKLAQEKSTNNHPQRDLDPPDRKAKAWFPGTVHKKNRPSNQVRQSDF